MIKTFKNSCIDMLDFAAYVRTLTNTAIQAIMYREKKRI